MRSDARETAFKIVFASLFHEVDEAFRAEICRRASLSEGERTYTYRVTDLVAEHREELSALLAERASGYAESRIYPVDKAILLVALAEIRYCEDIPPVVSASEAAALAAKYSTENSAGFVNGIIGGIINP